MQNRKGRVFSAGEVIGRVNAGHRRITACRRNVLLSFRVVREGEWKSS